MKIFLFYFEMAIKITGSTQNYRVGWVSGTTSIFLGLMCICHAQGPIGLNLRNKHSSSPSIFSIFT